MRTESTIEYIPDAEPVPVGPSPKALTIKTGKKKLVSLKDAQDAALRAGMTAVRADAIRGHKVLGDYIEQEGVIPVGRSILLFAHNHLVDGMNKCSELLTKTYEVEPAVELLKALQQLASAQIGAANSLIQSSKLSDSVNPAAPQQMQPFAPRQTVVPIQASHVTIQTTQPQ